MEQQHLTLNDLPCYLLCTANLLISTRLHGAACQRTLTASWSAASTTYTIACTPLQYLSHKLRKRGCKHTGQQKHQGRRSKQGTTTYQQHMCTAPCCDEKVVLVHLQAMPTVYVQASVSLCMHVL
jgi:hypothetical protein